MVVVRGTPVTLTRKEFELALLLFRRQGQPLSRAYILKPSALVVVGDTAHIASDSGIVMVNPEVMQRERHKGAVATTADDASIWRWLPDLLEERRTKWCCGFDTWIAVVDRK